VVRTLVSVAVLCAMVASGGGCASHKAKDREARAKGLKIPSDRSVLSGVASGRAKTAGGSHAGAQAFVAATPAPTPAPVMPAAMPMPAPAPVATSAPQFQPVDPTDYAAPRPAYALVAPTYAAPAPVRRPAPLPQAQPASAYFPKAAAGTRYQVQRGDTLFGIARTRYGDGKRWQQIASANPGLTPATLQAGATIVVP
jgi:5'-nucleotidase